ncbi:MAG: MmgE/PrpD family protein, partial [Burkholderiales bacterium]
MKNNSRHDPKIVRQLVTYISAAPRRRLPAHVLERAKHHLLDTLSAMLSGSQLLPGRRAIEVARAQGGNEEACVIGSGIVTSATMAALANGMHGHSDQTDDASRRKYASSDHVSCSGARCCERS